MNLEDVPYIPNWRDEVEEKVEEYRKHKDEIERQARQEIFDTFMAPGKNPYLRVPQKFNVPLGNEWVTEIEQGEVTPHKQKQITHHRRIIPTFYTWDEYRIYMHVIRVKADYNTVVDTIQKQGPLITDGIIILTVFEGTDHLIPFEEEHLSVRQNIFFVCVPELFTITVESDSEYIKPFNLTLSPLETVVQLKESIYRRRGFPRDRFDLIFDGQCMEDDERLLHYDLRNKGKVELVLQTGIRRQIKIFAFWEHVYYIEIDITTTASEIIAMVIRKCCTNDVETLQIRENYINPHHIVLLSDKGKTIGYPNCAQGTLEESLTDRLIMSERSNTVDEYYLEIHGLENGAETVKVTNGGKYLAAYLQIHGITGIPLNRMLLIGKEKTLNPYDVVNIERDGTRATVLLNKRGDDDPKMKFTINAILPSGVIHPLALKNNSRAFDINRELWIFGYEEILDYTVWYKNRQLKESSILYQLNVKNKDFVHVLPTYYPVFVVSPRNQKEKIRVHIKGSANAIIETGNSSFPAANNRPKYIFCGKPITDGNASIESLKIYPQNKIYQDLFDDETVLEFRMTARDPCQVVLKRNSIGFKLREGMAHYRLPRHVLDAVEQLVIWRITKPSPTEVVSHKGNSMDDAFYAATSLKLSGLMAPPHDPSTGLSANRTGVSQKYLINDKRVPPPNYTKVTLPPLVLRGRPSVVNYDSEEGLRSLLHNYEC